MMNVKKNSLTFHTGTESGKKMIKLCIDFIQSANQDYKEYVAYEKNSLIKNSLPRYE